MSHIVPRYFYICHLYIDHDVILQKIVTAGKVFRNHHPDCQLSRTNISKGHFTFIVSNDSPIDLAAIESFEKIVPGIEGVNFIFAQRTTNQGKSDEYPPTFVYSAYYNLKFNKFSYYLGRGLFFRKKLKQILEKLDGDYYFLHFTPTEMLLVLESTFVPNADQVDHLFSFVSAYVEPPVASYSSFPSTPAS